MSHSSDLEAWQRFRRYRLTYAAAALAWVFWACLPTNTQAGFLPAVKVTGFFALDAAFFLLSLYGLYLAAARSFPPHLGFFGLYFPFAHIIFPAADFTAYVFLFFLLLSDLLFHALLPPGTVRKILWVLWVQAKEDFRSFER